MEKKLVGEAKELFGKFSTEKLLQVKDVIEDIIFERKMTELKEVIRVSTTVGKELQKDT